MGTTSRVPVRERTEADATENLEDLVENGIVGLHRLSRDGIILWANRAEYEALGYQRDEYVGHDVREFHADPQLVDGLLERVAAGEHVRGLETVMRGRDGKPRHMLLTASARFDEYGRFRDTRGFSHDISEQKRREQHAADEHAELQKVEHAARERLALLARASDALAQSLDYERTLSAIFDVSLPSLGDFAFLDIREGDVIRRLTRAAGDEAGAALLRETDWSVAVDTARFDAGHRTSDDEPKLAPHFDRAQLDAIAHTAEQAAALTQLETCSMLSVPLRYQGASIGTLRFFYGASRRHHTDADLSLSGELARRASAAIVNARLFKEARDAIEVRDDFLSMAGHELRTPLTALQLQILSITKMAGLPDSVEKVAARADKAGRNVLRLSNLVNELLDISRISAGRLRLERAPMDMGDAVRDVLYRHTDELAKHGCEVHFTASGDLQGTWDRVRIEQIATNLLANAIKYGKGQPIEICVQRETDQARLLVRDHGIGISPEDQRRIFQRFERAVSARHFGGLGLGLWIARQLVDAHGGTIHVVSAMNQGATFEVLLPITPPQTSTGEVSA